MLPVWLGTKCGHRASRAKSVICARLGSDLLDIAGKVTYIGINSYQDGRTEIGKISSLAQVQRLVALVLAAPVDQQHVATETTTPIFVDFHLRDGTQALRAFYAATGELDFGIQTPPAFGQAIALAQHP